MDIKEECKEDIVPPTLTESSAKDHEATATATTEPLKVVNEIEEPKATNTCLESKECLSKVPKETCLEEEQSSSKQYHDNVLQDAGIHEDVPITIKSESISKTEESGHEEKRQSPVTQPSTVAVLEKGLLPSATEKSKGSAVSSPASSTPAPSPSEDISAEGQDSGSNIVKVQEGRPGLEAEESVPLFLSSGKCVVQPINVVVNGTIPKSGKPLMSAMSKKLDKSGRAPRQRKPKSLVAMYESEISENKIGIKLCIKKSENSLNNATATAVAAVARAISKSASTSSSTAAKSRKSSRSLKTRVRLDSDGEGEYEPKRKKERQKKLSSSAGGEGEESRGPIEQSCWGSQLPHDILYKIFQIVIDKEGYLPTLFRLGRVCSLWRRVSLTPTLWKTMDLSTYIKEKNRTEMKLKWFVENRCSRCTELNVSNWKVSDINSFLDKLATSSPNLIGITLSGWKGFTSDHLTFLVENMKKLERIDLSSINVEMNASKSAVGIQSLCNSLQTMKERLTHLYLAHNRLAGIPQIVNILSTCCPNLVLLDLSNVTTQATSHGILHIEKLQHGCRKLRVLRVTNSHVTLGTATMQEIMDSPGFPELEELSIAALTDESRVIGDEHLQRILKSSSKLKLLDVRGCTRLTHESLIRLPAWDIKHLFLSGCSVTRDMGSGLELIASKWAHSLIELDLAWANVQQPLDNALHALADKGSESRLAHLNLCGSSVSEEAVKEILANCTMMSSINLSSCRGLPRGVKRLMQGPQELNELREVLKVQLKVALPMKQHRPEQSSEATRTNSDTGADGDGGGGGEYFA